MQVNNFRSDVHALRAIAVLSVLFYHAGLVIDDFKILSGGFLGVDIFFVISGFLITRILIKDFNENKFSFLKFYERRIRRIFPSLFLLLIIVSIASIYLMNEKQYYENSNAILATLFFGSNFFFLFQDSYTSVSSQFKPLIHTWSLGVEEQFYLFFPIIIFILLKFKQNLSIYIIFLITISLTSCFILNNYYPEKNFYISTSRFWELLAGSLVYLIKINFKKNILFAKHITVLFWILLIFFLFYFNNKINHPGWPNFIIVCITSLIIFFEVEDIKLIKSTILKFFADISYTLYLFHLPLYSFSRIKLGELTNFQEIILLILSIVISSLVFYSYENKIKKIKLKYLISILSIFSFLLLSFSLFNIYKSYNNKRININNQSYIIDNEKEKRWEYLKTLCTQIGWENCYKPQKNKINFLVIGDSMSPDSGNIVNYLFNKNNIHIITDTLGGCQPHPNIKAIAPDNHPNLKKCIERNNERFSKEYYVNIDVIFIHNHYSWFEPDYIIPYINFLKSIGKNKIILVGNYLHLDKDFVETLRQNKFKSLENLDEIKKSVNIISELKFNDELTIISKNNDLFYINFNSLCNPDCALFTDKGYPFSWDQFHMSKKFIEYFLKNFFDSNNLEKFIFN